MLKEVRRRRGAEVPEVSAPAAAPSDALVFFGVTGDLAYKQIFPALFAMCRHGALNLGNIIRFVEASAGPR